MLTHKGTETLVTERLILRAFTPDDAQAMYDGWTSDFDNVKYLRFPVHESVEQTRSVLTGWQERYAQPDFYLWAVELRETGALIGSLGLSPVNEADECYEVGYCQARAYWGQGYMTEALRAVIAFAFVGVGINRIQAGHSVLNPASGAVMRRAGMLYEGMSRQLYKCAMGFQDCNLYGIVRSDFMD